MSTPATAPATAQAVTLVTPASLAMFLGLPPAEAESGRLDAFAAGASAFLLRRIGRDYVNRVRGVQLMGTDTPYVVLPVVPVTAVLSVVETPPVPTVGYGGSDGGWETRLGSTAAFGAAGDGGSAPRTFAVDASVCADVVGYADDGSLPPALEPPPSPDCALVDARTGVLARLDGRVFARGLAPTVSVRYRAGGNADGQTGAPPDVASAALELAAWAFQTTGGRQSVGLSGNTAMFVTLGPAGVDALPMVAAAINAHRDPLTGH